jgi:hypothetical protein
MKAVSWLVAIFVTAVGVAAIAAPDFVLGLRSLVATQTGLLAIAAFRMAVGVVLIMTAPTSRWPKALQASGAVVLLAGLATPLFGVDRTRAVIDWEAAQGPALMRLAGVILLAIGGFLAAALSPRKSVSAA